MAMALSPHTIAISGALLAAITGMIGGQLTHRDFATELERQAKVALERAKTPGIRAHFGLGKGALPTRHAVLTGGENLDDKRRSAAAAAVGGIAGVGGVTWADGTIKAERGEPQYAPTHCQDDVKSLLQTRMIRFTENSAAFDRSSRTVIDEVATALKPCKGGKIAITGHTDDKGDEAQNRALSSARAIAVRRALIARGISAREITATGLGSTQPLADLLPSDPANRRIEFAVIATRPLKPTPIDTPAPR